MPIFTYTKQANLRILTKELIAAGFTVNGLTQHHDTWELLVDVVSGDPSAVVAAHVYIEDVPFTLYSAVNAIKVSFIEASNAIDAANNATQLRAATQKLAVVVKRLGRLTAFLASTVELSDSEYDNGELDIDA